MRQKQVRGLGFILLMVGSELGRPPTPQNPTQINPGLPPLPPPPGAGHRGKAPQPCRSAAAMARCPSPRGPGWERLAVPEAWKSQWAEHLMLHMLLGSLHSAPRGPHLTAGHSGHSRPLPGAHHVDLGLPPSALCPAQWAQRWWRACGCAADAPVNPHQSPRSFDNPGSGRVLSA